VLPLRANGGAASFGWLPADYRFISSFFELVAVLAVPSGELG
jgi:hypothetical protein